MWEYEAEALPGLEGELEWEGELEAESEEFFRRIAGLARRAASSPALRRIGLRAARGALSGLGGLGAAAGGALGGTQGAALGRNLGSVLGRGLSGMLPQREWELEEEMEGEWEVNPIRRVYPQALMEHLGHAAAEAETEEEAEAFLGALVPLAARAAPALMRVAPTLIRGVAGAARTLRANPATRPLVRAMPTVVRRTAQTLTRQAQQGRPVTPQRAAQTLARQTQRVISNPRQCAQAYQRSRALDRQFHRAAGPVASATREASLPPMRGHRCTCRRAATNGAGVR